MIDGLSLAWHWSPLAILFLLVLSALYLVGLRHASTRQNSEDAPVKTRHVASFFTAILVVALLLLSPIDTIARTQLFSVHMAQAVLLTTLCAPLILAGCPAILLRPLVQLPIIRTIVGVLSRPLVASITFNLLFLLWHTPKLFYFGMSSGTLYNVEMLSIFVASLLNWWPLLGSVRELRTISYPLQMLYAFFDGQPVDIFAFILVFSGAVLYPFYAIPAQLGLSAFADQAVGGALLLIPGLIDLVVMSPLFFRWLGQIEQQTKLKDQQRQERAAMEEEYEEYEEIEEEQTSDSKYSK